MQRVWKKSCEARCNTRFTELGDDVILLGFVMTQEQLLTKKPRGVHAFLFG